MEFKNTEKLCELIDYALSRIDEMLEIDQMSQSEFASFLQMTEAVCRMHKLKEYVKSKDDKGDMLFGRK